MNTQGKRLEATLWLKTAFPNILTQQREEFLRAVEDYYEEHSVAEKPKTAFESLQHDERTFARILRNTLGEDPPSAPNTSFDLS